MVNGEKIISKMVIMKFTEIVSHSAGTLTAPDFLTQIIKTIKEKAAKNVSLLRFISATINQGI